MPTLLQINVTVNSGSTGRIAEEIGQVAMSQGWESYIAFARNYQPSKSKTIKVGSDLDVKLHGVESRIFDNHGLASRKATRELVKEIDRIKPDVIHLHNIHGYYLNYKILFEYLATLSTPVVWTLHDCWTFTGHCAHFDMAGCEKWLSGCYNCPLKKDYPASLLFDRSKENYRDKKHYFNSLQSLTLVPVSDWLAGLVARSFLNKNGIQRIYNGVDIAVFTPAEQSEVAKLRARYGIDGKLMLLGVATTWDERKGLVDYVHLNESLDDESVIVLVGLSNEQIAALPKGIIGVNRTENVRELAVLYSAADIVLNLSYQETFGLTTVEGFACGTPGIVYNKTASPELMTADCGYVVDAGNVEQLSECVNSIRSKGKSHYSQACIQRAKSCFAKEERYAEYVALYSRLLNNKQ